MMCKLRQTINNSDIIHYQATYIRLDTLLATGPIYHSNGPDMA